MQRQIEQLYKPLFLYVRKRVNIQEDAEDLTQDVFYKLSKANNDNVDNIKSWLYTIAKNTITDYYRKKRIYADEINQEHFSEDIDEASVAQELSECIKPFINELPEEYRSIMILSELDGISQKEIAARLDMNYVTVRSKIQRGRKKLKEIFTDCCTIIQGGHGSILEYKNKKGCNSKNDC